jgi:transcription elongation GreA/GreB family factor
MQIDDKSIFAISNKSPLGIKLIGLKENDSIEFNTINYLVKKVI